MTSPAQSGCAGVCPSPNGQAPLSAAASLVLTEGPGSPSIVPRLSSCGYRLSSPVKESAVNPTMWFTAEGEGISRPAQFSALRAGNGVVREIPELEQGTGIELPTSPLPCVKRYKAKINAKRSKTFYVTLCSIAIHAFPL